MTQPRWTRVIDAAELSSEHPHTIKTDNKQIVLFRQARSAGEGGVSDRAADEIFAIDNRCPHEGYPLSTGMLKDGILTCEWHNWKFRLCDGECVLGGEDVRHYPLEVRDDGAIWLDLADPPAEVKIPDLYRSLEDAFFEDDWGQASRTVERLLACGEDARNILGFGCDWTAQRAPYGFDHGLAVAADIAALLGQPADDGAYPGETGILLCEALNLMVESNLRRPERQLGEPGESDRILCNSGQWPAVERELRARIEAEDLAGSEGLLRAALDAGAGPEKIFAWLLHAATDHFLGYGHSHIYCIKAEELLDVIGWQHSDPVLTSLVSDIVFETREDRLPYMRKYRRLVEPYVGRLDQWAARDRDDLAPLGGDTIIAAVVDGDIETALASVADALDRGVAPDRIALALALAAAHRLIRFDHELEHDDEISEGWLHVTHALTHADAVRESLLRRPSAEALRGLLHSARFVQHLAVCDAPVARRPQVPDRTPRPEADDLGLTRALDSHDPAGAMAAMRIGLAEKAPVAAALRRAVLTDRVSIPIFVVHHIKTAMAALRLTRAAMADAELGQHPDRDLPALAAARFLAHPLKERRIARRAKVARTFVRDGRMQTKRLGY